MNKLDAGEILNAGRKKDALFRASKKTKRASERRGTRLPSVVRRVKIPTRSHKTRHGWGTRMYSMLDPLQAFFGAAIVVEEGERCMVFLGGSAMVALPFE
jgi:hypothetical protein